MQEKEKMLPCVLTDNAFQCENTKEGGSRDNKGTETEGRKGKQHLLHT